VVLGAEVHLDLLVQMVEMEVLVAVEEEKFQHLQMLEELEILPLLQ
tara:strand:- start:375 stop:512 length:138 start_codon:yes stop_codon:yes gene_type:complete